MEEMNQGKTELLRVSGIKKQFGFNVVLKGINLSVNNSEVLTLIGGNGAGKSTLMKIIMGIYQPDAGEMFLSGEKVAAFKPALSLSKGVYMVPQEPMLFPNMTVEENILAGFNEKYSGLHSRLLKIMDEMGWHLVLTRKALSLSIAEQQLVELLRGMMRNAKVLILDEPTSALTFDEVNALFKVIKKLQSSGIGIIYITHRLAEVFDIGTHVAIMRDGLITAEGPVSQFTREMLVKALLPPNMENSSETSVENASVDYDRIKPVFRLENYSGYGFENISMQVFPGEILGIAGLVGAGRTELAQTIFGRDKVLGGKAYLNDKDVTGLPTDKIIKEGITYVTEDRRRDGLFTISSVAANTTSSLLRGTELGKFLFNKEKEQSISDQYIKDFNIKVTNGEQEAGSLSGGNQQKVVIARSLTTKPKLIILDEPTRGIDAAARGDVYNIILKLKRQGAAIMLISSDMEEIVQLSDRAMVIYQGHATKTLGKSEINPTTLMNASFGVKDHDNEAAETA